MEVATEEQSKQVLVSRSLARRQLHVWRAPRTLLPPAPGASRAFHPACRCHVSWRPREHLHVSSATCDADGLSHQHSHTRDNMALASAPMAKLRAFTRASLLAANVSDIDPHPFRHLPLRDLGAAKPHPSRTDVGRYSGGFLRLDHERAARHAADAQAGGQPVAVAKDGWTSSITESRLHLAAKHARLHLAAKHTTPFHARARSRRSHGREAREKEVSAGTRFDARLFAQFIGQCARGRSGRRIAWRPAW